MFAGSLTHTEARGWGVFRVMSDLGMLGNVVKWKYKGSENILQFQFSRLCVPVSLFSLRQRQQPTRILATTEKMLSEIIIDETT